jgi:activator of HSP90 ATPase
MPKSIRQQLTFNAAPKEIYAALADSAQHAAFTGAAAKIGTEVGEPFSAHAGYIRGITVELVPGKRIVQAWRGKNWPKGVYSITSFELEAAGKGKARLIFTQHGVPDRFHAQISDGWNVHYWQPLRKWLAARALTKPARRVKVKPPPAGA